ncbi:hypothetical protein GKZ68_05410 [Hymenobacter sp. BRD128]|uniref:hypothetical protein n=1 Tax=Hymenobacter sp. BRD128 TaxID=2675878 RepID=UPI00156529EA|nr:hypothetical protein [Hymenobacter sp. BRD128]QKG56128.1 hypothetical protein GKZ68_05410 [Hymenobacter sp. BRD128]
MDKPTQRIIRNNLLIILAIALLQGLLAIYLTESAIFWFALLYLGQVVTNLVLGLRHWGNATSKTGPAPYFLSMLLVLIIGFGSCAGIFELLDINGGPPAN